MKKLTLLLVLALIITSFAACGGSDVTSDDASPETTEATKTENENVEISVSKEFVADETVFLVGLSEIGEITSTAKDDLYVLSMSKETHKKLLSVKAKEVTDEYDGLVAQGKFIEKITYDDSFRAVKVYVNRGQFEAVDASTRQLQAITIGAKAMSYQIYLADGPKTSVSMIYSDTEELVFTISLPVEM